MKLRHALPLLASLGLLALEASGDAPATQYAPFNSTNAWITDQSTKLEWERNAEVMDFSLAATYCAGMSSPDGVSRLPTVKELLTLVDENPHAEFDGVRAIDRNAFPRTDVTHAFFSQGDDGKHAWVVHFDTGRAEAQAPLTQGTQVAVRCVYAQP